MTTIQALTSPRKLWHGTLIESSPGVPAVDVNAVYSADSGLAFLMLGYPLGGSESDTYGALYDLDGHARVPPTVLSSSAGHDIDGLAACGGGRVCLLFFCRGDSETYRYACEIGRIDESGIVSSPSDVRFSFGSGAAFWNKNEFVVVAARRRAPGCSPGNPTGRRNRRRPSSSYFATEM